MFKKIFFMILFSCFAYANTTNFDLSFNALFMNASIFVKSVIIFLIFLSVLSWSIYIAKIFKYILTYKVIFSDIKILKTQGDFKFKHKISKILLDEINDEINKTTNKNYELKERIKLRLETILSTILSNYKSGINLLASIGVLSPFIGLFGTIWGIMNSFVGIANSNNASLNAVAPGIAEALFATAFGLGVAIPAVFFHNHLTKLSSNFAQTLNELATFLYICNDRKINVD